MDSYFKVICAEEICHLNIETSRLATFICDEDAYLRSAELILQPTDADLAYQIQLHCRQSSRFLEHHMEILNKIAQFDGYTGGPLLGTCAEEATGPSLATQLGTTLVEEPSVVEEIDSQLDLEEEQAGC